MLIPLKKSFYFCCNQVCYSYRLSSSLSGSIKKVLLLTKISRYEYEKKCHLDLPDRELEEKLRNRGSDYNLLLYHHYIHKGIENSIKNGFEAVGVETKVVTRHDYSHDLINWADVVVTSGGDGTFLFAATKILNNKKPVIGFNSDPLRSKGHLCLPSKYSVDIKGAIDKIVHGEFKWKYRKRIRVTLIGENIQDPPIELSSQKVLHPEMRYLDIDPEKDPTKIESTPNSEHLPKRVLPYLSLNEVFIGECVSARVSSLQLSFDKKEKFSRKCSGFIASTGTGSTSWTYNINKLTDQSTESILTISREMSGLPLQDSDPKFVRSITEKFNQMLVIDPEESKMVYTIRDVLPSNLMSSDTAKVKPRGFARFIFVKSRCFDASLVIDGGASFRFNDGTCALLEICEPDALRTVSLIESPQDQQQPSFKH